MKNGDSAEFQLKMLNFRKLQKKKNGGSHETIFQPSLFFIFAGFYVSAELY